MDAEDLEVLKGADKEALKEAHQKTHKNVATPKDDAKTRLHQLVIDATIFLKSPM